MSTESWDSDGSYEWEVPDNVDEVDLLAEGASGGEGGDSDPGSGGLGSRGERTIGVSPGDKFYIYVGGKGKDAFMDDPGSGGYHGGGDGGPGEECGGGGGGRSEIRYKSDDPDAVEVVGGGGGGGGGGGVASGGDGGDGGESGSDGDDPDYNNDGEGGDPGSDGEGGEGGLGREDDGDDGGDWDGGDGGEYESAGGGGGGGYGGGGGGGAERNAGGGGGGGGNYGSSSSNGVNNGDGYVEISYEEKPGEPTNVTADKVRLNEVSLTWDQNDSGSDPDEYEIYRNGGEIATTSSKSYTDDELSQNTEYEWHIVATNEGGDSDDSDTVTETTGGHPPGFDTDGHDEDSIDLSWDGPRGDFTEIRLYRTTADDPSFGDDYEEISTFVDSRSYTDDGLTNDREYTYVLTTAYNDGESDPTGEESATTDLPAPTLDSVMGGDREVVLEWTIEDNNGDGDLAIYRDGDEVETIDDLDDKSYTDDEDVLDGEKYEYYVERDTGDATATSNNESTTTALPAPTDLSVDDVTDETVGVSWSANHDNGDTRVEFRRAGETSSWSTYSTVSRTTESETIDGLLNGEEYEIRVVAVTDDAEEVDE